MHPPERTLCRIDSLDELANPPSPPRDVDLFTSNELFGEPGIYPDGSPMVPAPGPPMPDHAVRGEVARVLTVRHEPDDVAALVTKLDDPPLVAAVPDLGVRAGLVLLAGTVAGAVLAGFPGATTARRLAYGTPASPGRVVGPPETLDPAALERVVNARYRAEHPALLAPSLAHDLLWTPTTTGHAAEATLHALAAMVHVQLVARVPDLARLGTELARRQNSLAITLLHSHRPGDRRLLLRAPDGSGTIPGGDPAMQTPDFWSIPFGPERVDPAPPLLARVLDALVPPGTNHPAPLRFDDSLAGWIDGHGDQRWLPPAEQRAALDALGLPA